MNDLTKELIDLYADERARRTRLEVDLENLRNDYTRERSYCHNYRREIDKLRKEIKELDKPFAEGQVKWTGGS